MANKPSWLFNQSGVIPYVIEQGVTKYVLVSSSRKNGWVFPKGVVEKFMSPEDSAVKEALEEAGVIGEIEKGIFGEYKYEKWGGVCTVKVYALKVTEILSEWEEDHKRERVVVRSDESLILLKPEAKPIFESMSLKIENYV